MPKITKLTDEQEAAIPEWVERYLAIGLCTDPIDRTTLRQIVDPLYRMLGRKPPLAIVVMDGPAHAWLATAMLSVGQVESQVWSQVESQVESQVRSQVWSQVRSQVESQVRSQVWSQVRSQVESQVWSQVRSQVWSQVESQVGSQVWSQVESFLWPYCSGQFFAFYFSYFDFHEWLGVTGYCDTYRVYRRTADLSLVYPLDNFCVLSDRLARAQLADGVLHSIDGPAVAYRDGTRIWSVGGVRVDEQIVMRPQTQKVAQIDDEPNAEVKRIRIERFGWQKYLRAKRAKVLDHRRNDIEQTDESLMRCGDMTVFIGACPSTARVYALEVDPKCKTVEQAQNFLNGGRTRRLIGAS